jgi:hypothetical protein
MRDAELQKTISVNKIFLEKFILTQFVKKFTVSYRSYPHFHTLFLKD